MTHKISANLNDEQAIMPTQWKAMLENPHAMSPERRLVLAVIEDALRLISHKRPAATVIRDTSQPTNRPTALTWWRAYDWLVDLESRYPFSLVWICEVLAGPHDDAFAIAKRIADRVRVGEPFEIMQRRPVAAIQKVGLVWRRKRRA